MWTGTAKRVTSLAVAAAMFSTSPAFAEPPTAPSSAKSSATTAPDNASDKESATRAEPAEPTPSSGPDALRKAGYVSLGVGAVGLILFAGAGLSAKTLFDHLEHDCGSTPCTDAAHRSDIETGKLAQGAANVGLILGVAGLTLGATLLLVGNPAHPDAKVSASVTPGGGGISYVGSF